MGFLKKDAFLQMLALTFLILIPFSFLLSPFLFLIPIFLYFFVLTLQDKGWIISQRWMDVVFIHYKVDAKELQKIVPFPLDLFEGEAVVSIVPFVMGRIRFPFLIPIPGLSKLLELNLRTYVTMKGKPAVYFFTLDSNHLPEVLIARWFFALPYRLKKLAFFLNDFYHFKSPEFSLKAVVGEVKQKSAFDVWATERYALLTKRGHSTYMGIVEHRPWTLQKLEVKELTDHFSILIGEHFKMKEIIETSYSKNLDVRFRSFRRVGVHEEHLL